MINYQRVQFTAAVSGWDSWFLWIHPALVLRTDESFSLLERMGGVEDPISL
jgi:hypothetical protein